jgi:ketosteroid isomerase-like protein
VSEAELVRRIYELSAEDPTGWGELIDPDIEWDTSAAPSGTRTRGADAALADYRGMLEAWDEYESVVERIVPVGDLVLAVVRNRGRGRAGGVPIEAVRAHVWRVRDGRAVSMRQYMDPRDAFAALGVDPEP